MAMCRWKNQLVQRLERNAGLTARSPAHSAQRNRDENCLYSPVSKRKREIRLCYIKPASGQQISCTLKTVSLDDDIQYEALSYVWGDPNDCLAITVNGQEILVTRNLATALRWVSSVTTTIRCIWIDAVCINQVDIPERNAQVLLMGDIYNKAQRVVAWLGEDLEGSMKFACQHLRAFREHRDPTVLTGNGIFEGVNRRIDQTIVEIAPRLLGNGLNGPEKSWDYWHRVWTAQEVIKAKRVVLQTASVEMPLEWLEEFSQYMAEVARRDGLNHPMALANVLVKTAPSVKPGSHHAPLLDVLNSHRRRNSSDPRDKIYGFLGISDLKDSHHPGLKVDYSPSHSVRKVYIGAAQAIIESTSKLDVILQRNWTELYPSFQLPTWVPDWSSTGDTSSINLPSGVTWNASGKDAQVKFRSEEGIDVLSSTGILFGKVCAVSSRIQAKVDGTHALAGDDYGKFYGNLVNTLGTTDGYGKLYGNLISTLGRTYDQLEKLASPKKLRINVWETLNPLEPLNLRSSALRQDLFIYQASRLDRREYPFALEELFPPGMVNGEFVEANYKVLILEIGPTSLCAIAPMIENAQVYSHNLWESDPLLQRWKHLWDGDLILGMCPSSAREGDLVVILPGCQCPVILRPKWKYFEFIGAVYIQGVNEGGLVDDIEKGRHPSKVFDLI
jgi:hypothetical protein